MKRDAKAYLHDVQEAGEHILDFTKGMSMEDYCRSELVRSAVERKFVTIGEALVRLRVEYPEILSEVQNADRIIGFRNVLVHGYDIIEDATVWSAVATHLPPLLARVRALLSA